MRPPRSFTRTLAGALTAPLFLLAACGGGDDSVADPPVSPSSTSSSTGTPQPETAEAFIHRWIQVEKKMENTGEIGNYMAISGQCNACRQLAREVKTYYAAGGYIHWSGWKVLSITSSGSHDGSLVFVVKVDSGPTRYRESSTGPIHHLNGGPSTHQLAIRRVHGEWHVLEKAQLST